MTGEESEQQPSQQPSQQSPRPVRRTRSQAAAEGNGRRRVVPNYNIKQCLSFGSGIGSGNGGGTRNRSLPRWYNQTYLLFSALKQAKGVPLHRGELIKRALDLDKEIAASKGWTPVFGGKTPQNTASAILTENRDKYFIPNKPVGSRTTYFTLSYEPGNFDLAVQEYNSWMERLIQIDWPVLFGKDEKKDEKKEEGDKTEDGEKKTEEEEEEEGAEKEKQEGEETEDNDEEEVPPAEQPTNDTSSEDRVMLATTWIKVDPEPEKETTPKKRKRTSKEIEEKENAKKKMSEAVNNCVSISTASPVTTNATTTALSEHVDSQQNCTDTLSTTAPVAKPTTTEESEVTPSAENTNTEPTAAETETVVDPDIPKSLDEIVEVKESSIPGAGKGLFAKRLIPAWTIMGFYFGVPMTEDDFDATKDNIGQASHYSIRYRKTVLDATDEKGMPFVDHPKLFCPFHFMNEDVTNGNVAFIEGSVVNQVICMTTKDVQPGEEFFVNYGKDVDRSHWNANQSCN